MLVHVIRIYHDVRSTKHRSPNFPLCGRIIVTNNFNIWPSVFLLLIHGQLNTVYFKTTFHLPPVFLRQTEHFYFIFAPKNSLPALSHSLLPISLLSPDWTFYTHYFECLSFHSHLCFNEVTGSCLQFPSPLLFLYVVPNLLVLSKKRFSQCYMRLET